MENVLSIRKSYFQDISFFCYLVDFDLKLLKSKEFVVAFFYEALRRKPLPKCLFLSDEKTFPAHKHV